MANVPMLNLKTMFLTLLIVALLASCSEGSGNLETTQTAWNEQVLQRTVEDWRIRSNVPGVVVGLSLPGHSEILLTSGESNIQTHTPIEPEDQFQIASITKTFIAAKILLLAAEGKLALDHPLDRYLRDIPHGEIVTIRNLLSHRSGYFDPIHDDPGFIPFLAGDLTRQWSWMEVLEIVFQHDLFFPPGSDYRYSNTNYLLLALVIEEIKGQPLGEVLADSLFSRLQLARTRYRTVATDIHQTDLVHGYATHPVTGEVVDTMSIPSNAILSVSTDTMISNASDLLKWSKALYGNHPLLLDPSLKQQMLRFDEISPYGLGVFRFQTPLGVSFGHGGDTAGYLSQMEYFPEQDASIVILVNADAPSIRLTELRDELLAILFPLDQEEGMKQLLADLESADASVRKSAIIALGHSSPGSAEGVSALIEALKQDASAENRREAALALGLAGQNSDLAIQALTGALQDPDDSVRGAASIALGLLNRKQ